MSSVSDPRLAAIGQETLTVTPLHMALVMAALGNEGRMPSPVLVFKEQAIDGTWRTLEVSTADPAVSVTDPAIAARLRALLRPSVDERVVGYSALALAGADRAPHAWYLALAPAQAPRYAVVVLLEHSGTSGLTIAEQIGWQTLLDALASAP
jgi:peptidoglycan glycosyltransferase